MKMFPSLRLEPIASNRVVSGGAAQSTLVGRGVALEVLSETWQRALNGERQIVFITGEPGIGKTALAEEFRRQVAVGELSIRIALTREHREMLQREILGANRERMVREIGDALESITAETALLLVFEDLNWVDDSTVDLISVLARRRSPAKLMLLATCRPLDLK